MDFNLGLDGKSVVVTGAGSNIGRAIALIFGHCGAKVAILDIDVQAAATVADELNASGACPSAIAVEADVTDPAKVEASLQEVLSKHGQPDIWVNNVGWTMDRLFLEKPREELEKEVQLNLVSILD